MGTTIECPTCGETFTTKLDQRVHAALDHTGRMRSTRPVSCWACAADISTRRNEAGAITADPCQRCGWVHPHIEAA